MFYYYETTIFESYIGLPPITSFGLSGAATTCGLISVWITTTLIKKTGRKKWLMWGAVAQRIFTIGFIGLLAHPGHKAGAGAAAMFFCWIVSNGLTWAPLSVRLPNSFAYEKRADRKAGGLPVRDHALALPTHRLLLQHLMSMALCLRHGIRWADWSSKRSLEDSCTVSRLRRCGSPFCKLTGIVGVDSSKLTWSF